MVLPSGFKNLFLWCIWVFSPPFSFLFPYPQVFKGHRGKGVSHLGEFRAVVLKRSGKGERSPLGKSC